jgi:hypothetical protein
MLWTQMAQELSTTRPSLAGLSPAIFHHLSGHLPQGLRALGPLQAISEAGSLRKKRGAAVQKAGVVLPWLPLEAEAALQAPDLQARLPVRGAHKAQVKVQSRLPMQK